MNKRHKLALMSTVISVAMLVACSPQNTDSSKITTNTTAASAVQRPTYKFADVTPYDANAVGQYTGNHSAVYDYIDTNLGAHVGNIQRWLRQPSISAQNVGVRDMAEMVRSDFEKLGFQETAIVETDGHPGVWGYYDAGAETTLMVYMMYDVQPVDPEDWQSAPFEANIVDHKLGKVIMARGATNQKGPERALLNAVESIIAVDGKLPVNLMITAEGEEELGSPHYPQIVSQYEDRLRTADGVIFPFNSQAPDGNASILLGVKGLVYFELEAQGGDWGGPTEAEIHGSYKAIVDSPVWRLVKALSTLVSEDGNTVLVPGFYDDVRAPTDEEQALIAGLLKERNDTGQQDLFKVKRWIDDMQGAGVVSELIYTPTLNIDGIYGGYDGVGVKTILPHKATAKLDSRLPYGINPDDIMAKIRAHLDTNGYKDVTIRQLSGYPAAQTSVTSPLVTSIVSVFNKYGATPTLNPRIAGSAPFYQFTERLGLPMVPTGFGFGTGAHAPNEIMLIEPAEGVGAAGLADIEKAYVDMLYALAGAKAK